MRTIRPFEIVILAFALGAGIFLFVRAWMLSDAVPLEYRSASPGFNWGWEFDYEGSIQADKFGETAWPWPAQKTGNRIVLPQNQPLVTEGLKLTYQGMVESDRFRLDVVIQNLDADVTYPQEFDTTEAGKVIIIDEQQFVLEKITPRYLLLIAQPDADR